MTHRHSVLRDDSTAIFLSREGAGNAARRIARRERSDMVFALVLARKRGEHIGWKLIDNLGVEVTEDRAAQ